MRAFGLRMAIAGLAAALVGGVAACGKAPPERIVLIVVDTLRRDHLSWYGDKATTPYIDGLAARGQIFENVHSSFSQTTMSMASLFTGRTPSLETGDPTRWLPWNGSTWCGLARFAEDAGEPLCVPGPLSTLAEEVRQEGYWTIGVASNPFLFRPAGFDAGFDDWVEVGTRGTTIGDSARGWSERRGQDVNAAAVRALGRRPREKFFLYVHYMDVHDYAMAKTPYEEGVRAADAAVGALLETLDQEGILEDAVVVLTSDHGERLDEEHVVKGMPSHMGNPSFDELLKVPLIVSPAVYEDTGRFLRGDDVFRMVREIAGRRDEAPADLLPGEHFASELHYVTYRRGRWKTFHSRGDQGVILIDLEADPGETRDVSQDGHEALERHVERALEIGRTLASKVLTERALSDEEIARLRSLGYLE